MKNLNVDEEIKLVVKELLKKESSLINNKTGACSITVATGNRNYCFDGLSQKSCSDIAEKFGGTSSWVEGAKCS